MSFDSALQVWPVLLICAGMIACAVIDWWKFKVPNKLTFPLILGGWLLGLLNLWQLVPFGGLGGVVMIALRGNYRQNAQHVRSIVGDLFTSTGVADVAGKANKRRPRWHRLPYGVPLCIGFVGYLVYFYSTTLVP